MMIDFFSPPRAGAKVALMTIAMIASGADIGHSSSTPDDLAQCQSEDVASDERMKVCTRVLEDRGQIAEIRAEAALNRGVVRFSKDQLDEALADFETAISLNSDYPTPYYYRGMVHQHRGDNPTALTDLSTAIRLDANNVDALEARGRVHLLMRNPGKAVVDFDAAIVLVPDDPDLYAGRGMAREALGEFSAAMADFKKALLLDPTHEEASEGSQRLAGKT